MKQAFTLIELLVVVLIIGILAAVALPQYQKAVNKSRIAGEELVRHTLSKAIDVWVLENGLPDSDFYFTGANATGKLDIDIPWKGCDTNHCSTEFVAWEVLCNDGGCFINADSYGVENSPLNYEGGWENRYDGAGWNTPS